MRFSHLLAALPLTGVQALTPRNRLSQKLVPPKDGVRDAPKKFIVEVTAGADIAAVSAKIESHGATVLKTFDTDVFKGFSVESPYENVDSLQAVDGIHQAWSSQRFTLDPITPQESFSDDATFGNYSVHRFTGVQKLHDEGVFGKGAIVGIVDTGTFYPHPALGGGFGPGYKVAGGYDLVGDGAWPETPKEPDADPLDSIGHGTHVAGIIAGKSDWFTGVAPEATLLSYKVFSGADDGTDEETLIDAFLLAYQDGADIITSSIGGPSGWSDGAWATVASRLVEQGVVVTISAGNSGDDGPFFASSGSSGKNVLAIASTDASVIAAPPFKATFSLDGVTNVTYLGFMPGVDQYDFASIALPVVPLTYDTTIVDDACNPLPAGLNLTGTIPLVRRGTCNFSVKQNNVAVAGARSVIFYNTETQPIVNPGSIYIDIPVALIEASAGQAIVDTIQAGGSVTADFTIPEDTFWSVGLFNAAGGIPSEYTSWGGTFELNLKPDVAAPGRDIYSTYLDDTYAILSGTSMACPYIAGVAALYVGKYGGRKVHGAAIGKQIANRIRSSGAAVPWQIAQPDLGTLPIDYGFWAPTVQVGSGLVNASKVLDYDTQLSFDNFALNDTSHFSRYQTADITNNGAKPITYTFSLQPAGGFSAQSPIYADFLASYYEFDPYEIVPEVTFPSGKFTVQPGETKEAQFNFHIPAGLNASLLPVYSGKVLISGSNGEELSIPYFGAGFDLTSGLRRDIFSDPTPYQMSGPNRDDISIFHTYDFNLSYYAQDFPKFYADFKWGTKELRFDIFEKDWKETQWVYPPVAGKNGYVGSATYYIYSDSYYNFDPSYLSKDDVVPFPLTDLFRTSTWEWYDQGFWWFGKLANGTYIAPGDYNIRFAALVPFGNPAHSDNWDIFKTPVITVLPYTP